MGLVYGVRNLGLSGVMGLRNLVNGLKLWAT